MLMMCNLNEVWKVEVVLQAGVKDVIDVVVMAIDEVTVEVGTDKVVVIATEVPTAVDVVKFSEKLIILHFLSFFSIT
jgi:hypothetical protein